MTYIRTTPEKLWSALSTDSEFMKQYWFGVHCESQYKPELKSEGVSLCTMELEPSEGAVRLAITHTIERDPSKFIEAVSGGWPKILSNLKSLLETGSIALKEAYPTER